MGTLADKKHSGWVTHLGLLPASEPQGVLAPANKLTVERRKSGGAPLVTAGFRPTAASKLWRRGRFRRYRAPA